MKKLTRWDVYPCGAETDDDGHWVLAYDVDDLEAENQRLKAALEVCQQALLEINHAQRNGPSWYTKGEKGMYGQVRMWIDKAIVAINAVKGTG